MSIVKSATETFNVVSESAGPIAATPWMLRTGTDHLRVLRNLQGTAASLTSKAAYQTASVLTSEPDGWQPATSTSTGNGYETEDFDLSATATNKLWVRGGVFASSSGQDDGQVEGTGMVEGKGRIVASGRQLLSQTSGSYHNEVPVTKPLPLVGMSGVMPCFDFEYQGASTYLYPVYRLLTDDPNAGGAWSLLASPSAFTSSQTYNSDLQSLADDTSKCWFQLGLRWRCTAGSAFTKYIFAAVYE